MDSIKSVTSVSKWPKILPPITAEQKRISDDFMQCWLEILPKKFSTIEKFNHGFPVWSSGDFKTTLEIGAGLGEHLTYEKLTDEQKRNYYCNDIRQNMVDEIKKRYPEVNVAVGDCQKTLPFQDGFFDRVLAIHVLEHLPNLPAALKEVHRLISPEGHFIVVIPMEGSLAYSFARKISAERVYCKRYKHTEYPSYHWFYSREHINVPSEILDELKKYFVIDKSSYFPLKVPFEFCNLVMGLVLKPIPAAQ